MSHIPDGKSSFPILDDLTLTPRLSAVVEVDDNYEYSIWISCMSIPFLPVSWPPA